MLFAWVTLKYILKKKATDPLMKFPVHLYSRLLVSRIFNCFLPFCEPCVVPNKLFQFEFVVHKLRNGVFSYNNLNYLCFPGKSFSENSTKNSITITVKTS